MLDLGRLEGLKAGGEVQVAVKQRMVSDLPEGGVGDLISPSAPMHLSSMCELLLYGSHWTCMASRGVFV